MSFSPEYFVPLPSHLCMEITSYIFLPKSVFFFYLEATGWIFDINLLCENSFNQSIAGDREEMRTCWVDLYINLPVT